MTPYIMAAAAIGLGFLMLCIAAACPPRAPGVEAAQTVGAGLIVCAVAFAAGALVAGVLS